MRCRAPTKHELKPVVNRMIAFDCFEVRSPPSRKDRLLVAPWPSGPSSKPLFRREICAATQAAGSSEECSCDPAAPLTDCGHRRKNRACTMILQDSSCHTGGSKFRPFGRTKQTCLYIPMGASGSEGF